MIPWRRTANRSRVMPTSRPMITTVIHQGTWPSSDSPTSAEPISALSAIGSAMVPNAVTRPRLRASSPSNRSVIAASANTAVAANRQPVSVPASCISSTRNTGTSSSRTPVSTLAMLSSGGGPAAGALTALPRPCGSSPAPRRGRRQRRALDPLPRGDQQVGALGPDDDRPHQLADPQPAAALEHALAVHLRGLVRGPPGALHVLVLLRLDEGLDHGADAVLGALGHQLVGQRGDPGDPLGDDLGLQLAVVAGGLGAVLVGVAEHAHRIQPGAGEERLQLGQVVLGLAGEPDDDVAADAGLRGERADALAEVEEVRARAEAAH